VANNPLSLAAEMQIVANFAANNSSNNSTLNMTLNNSENNNISSRMSCVNSSGEILMQGRKSEFG
jgi:hypothetical protein